MLPFEHKIPSLSLKNGTDFKLKLKYMMIKY